MPAIRLFTGIPLSEPLSVALTDACEAVRATDPSWRDEKWVPAENLHVTLKFIGWMAEESVGALTGDVATAMAGRRAFELPFVGIKPVPTMRRARMLWGEFTDPEGLCTDLAEAIERAVLPYGIDLETRPFAPHATLVRARRPKPIADKALEAATEALAGAPSSMSVPSASLFTSRLTRRGPVYTELGSWALNGKQAKA